jgi:hypothetical protein
VVHIIDNNWTGVMKIFKMKYVGIYKRPLEQVGSTSDEQVEKQPGPGLTVAFLKLARIRITVKDRREKKWIKCILFGCGGGTNALETY